MIAITTSNSINVKPAVVGRERMRVHLQWMVVDA